MIYFNEKIYRLTLDEMNSGDTFIYEGEPIMKVCLESGKHICVNLVTGEQVIFSAYDELEPVNFELKRVKKEND